MYREQKSWLSISPQIHRELLGTRIEGIALAHIPSFFLSVSCDSVVDHLLDLSPKIADPTRTQVAPSSIAISKSRDIPIESSRILNAGNLRAI